MKRNWRASTRKWITSDHLQKMDEKIAEYRKTQCELEEEYEAIKQAAVDVVLTPEQEVEYEQVRDAAMAASAEPKQVLMGLQHKLKTVNTRADSQQ